MENKKETKGLLGKIRKSGKALALVGALAAAVGYVGSEITIRDPITAEYVQAVSDEIKFGGLEYSPQLAPMRDSYMDMKGPVLAIGGYIALLVEPYMEKLEKALMKQKELEEVNPSLRNEKYKIFDTLGYDIRPKRY